MPAGMPRHWRAAGHGVTLRLFFRDRYGPSPPVTDTCPPNCAHCAEYPDHQSAHQAVVEALQVMGAHPEASEDEIVQMLQARGYSAIVAEKLNAFVPSALSWPLLKRLGVETFVGHFIAYDDNDQEVQIPVSSQHYFTAALMLAYNTLEDGWSEELPHSTFVSVTQHSAEMNAANKLLNQGGSLEGGTIGPLQLLRLSASEVLGQASS